MNDDKYEELCDKYQSVFIGLGKLKDKQIKFHVDENVVPIAQSARRISFHMREKVEQEIKRRLEQLDAIEKRERADSLDFKHHCSLEAQRSRPNKALCRHEKTKIKH